MVITAILVALSLSGAGQVAPPPAIQAPRDPGRRMPEPVGSGVIRGRVVAADTGNPVRRATVNLTPAPPPIPLTTSGSSASGVVGSVVGGIPAPPPGGSIQTITSNNGTIMTISPQAGMVRRTATTDAQGVFEFKGLPPGSYRLSAQPGQYSAAYLPMNYGAKKANAPGSTDPGTPIELADGQAFDKATIALSRGAVVVGRVTDENGDPLARVQVYTVMYLPGSSRGLRNGGNAQTDDLGQFRIFGLAPGDYTVAAEARGNSFVPPNAPPENEEDKNGFMTTFFPATTDEGAAQRVHTKPGAETPGVEIHMVTGRLFHLTGMVTDSQGRTGVRSSGSLYQRTASGMSSSWGFATDDQGRFQMRNIPPGNYRLTVRQQPMGPRNPDGSPGEQGEFASMPIAVNTDMDDILVTTSPGATIMGTVVFESGPPQLPASQASFQMRVNASPGDPENMMGSPPPQPALVTPDLTFTMKGLMGEFLLRSNAPGNYLKSVQLGADDITDTPHEFKSGDRVTIVLTSRASTLEGAVTDDAGKPVTDAALMLFSDDKASWRTNSIRTRRTGVDSAGHYRLQGLLPGRYFLVAMPRDRSNALGTLDAAAFEALAKDATAVVIGEDEQRQVDLKVSGGER